jgi:hypothetical protein
MPLTSKAAAMVPKVAQKAMPFVQRIIYSPAPKEEAKAVSKQTLHLVAAQPKPMPKIETKAMPKIETKAMPKAPLQAASLLADAAEDRRAAAKARATRFMLRVQRPPVEDVVPEDEPAPEFFPPGSLLHLLEPARPAAVVDVEDEDEDDSWGAEWPSPNA